MLAFPRLLAIFILLLLSLAGLGGSPVRALAQNSPAADSANPNESGNTAEGEDAAESEDAAENVDPATVGDVAAETDAEKQDGALHWIIYLVPLLGLTGLAFTFWKSSWVSRQEVGTEKMAQIASNIQEGAMSFLKAEYSILTIFVLAVAVLLAYAGTTQGDNSSPLVALSSGSVRFVPAWPALSGCGWPPKRTSEPPTRLGPVSAPPWRLHSRGAQ